MEGFTHLKRLSKNTTFFVQTYNGTFEYGNVSTYVQYSMLIIPCLTTVLCPSPTSGATHAPHPTPTDLDVINLL